MSMYCNNNGIYTPKEFVAGLSSKGQGIKHSGVGGHYQNGVMENAIKNTVCTGIKIMIYTTLWCTKNAVYIDKELPNRSS